MAAKNTTQTFNMILCALFVALMIVGTYLRIPIPHLPITLQLAFALLAGLVLGGRLGFLSIAVYIIMGLLGLPVFTEGGGFGYIFKPQFGYIIGFAVAAYVTGKIANKVRAPGYKRLLAANFAGIATIYVFGMVYFYLISKLYLGTPIGIVPLFIYCFFIPISTDILLGILATLLGKRLIPLVNKMRG